MTGPKNGGRSAILEFSSDLGTIIAFKRLVETKTTSDQLSSEAIEFIETIQAKMIDAKSQQLKDFTLVIEKGIEFDQTTTTITDLEIIVTYICLVAGLDREVNIDSIKIGTFFGDKFTFPLTDKFWTWKLAGSVLYLLPIEQRAKRELDLSLPWIVDTLEVFSTLRRDNREQYIRIINALSLFNLSCAIVQKHPNSSLLLMTSAFEALLGLPRFSRSDHFAYAMKLIWGFNKRVEAWAHELYSIRSQIVHGNVIEGEQLLASKDKHYPHFSIGRNVFHDSLLFLLENYGFLDILKSYKEMAHKRAYTDMVSNKEKLQNLLSGRKNLNYSEFLSNRKSYEKFLSIMGTFNGADLSGKELRQELITIIFRIAEDWMKGELSDLSRYPDLNPQIIEFHKKTYISISDFFNYWKNTHSRSLVDIDVRLQLLSRINSFWEDVNALEPIAYSEDQVRFSLSEFLTLSLRPLDVLLE